MSQVRIMEKPNIAVFVGEVFGGPCLLAALAGSEEACFLSLMKTKENLTPEQRAREVILTFMGCLLLPDLRLPTYRFEFENRSDEAREAREREEYIEEAREQEERCMLTDDNIQPATSGLRNLVEKYRKGEGLKELQTEPGIKELEWQIKQLELKNKSLNQEIDDLKAAAKRAIWHR